MALGLLQDIPTLPLVRLDAGRHHFRGRPEALAPIPRRFRPPHPHSKRVGAKSCCELQLLFRLPERASGGLMLTGDLVGHLESGGSVSKRMRPCNLATSTLNFASKVSSTPTKLAFDPLLGPNRAIPGNSGRFGADIRPCNRLYTAGRARCFRHHKHFYSSLSAAVTVRTPLWRYGWARWPPARSNGAADGRERRASRWLRRMMSCVDVCDERLASRARATLD